ncbi:MAG: 50S ribosomal protein L19 [Candidatus Omnitrophota bacterium]
MDKISLMEKQNLKTDLPEFGIGDTVKVYTKIKEGDKFRLHPFEGTIIAKKGSGIRSAITVRRVSFGEGIERVFTLHSPLLDRIEVIRRATKVKRAKLYYLREKVGRETKI